VVEFISITIGATLTLQLSGYDWVLPTAFGAPKLLIRVNQPNKFLKA